MEITGIDSLPVLASFINVDRHCVCGERLCACVSVCVCIVLIVKKTDLGVSKQTHFRVKLKHISLLDYS